MEQRLTDTPPLQYLKLKQNVATVLLLRTSSGQIYILAFQLEDGHTRTRFYSSTSEVLFNSLVELP